ncbi:MAG: hypothetical protein LBH48_03070 [Bifidobacteriaceae bacterium]|nr:hypothetical protein [Bifidobacteriaceae bacterium]
MNGMMKNGPGRALGLVALGIAGGVIALAGCGPEHAEEVATLEVGRASSSAAGHPDQYSTASALQGCLADAGLPAVVVPVDGGEAEVGWAEGHEVVARDLDGGTTMLAGPSGAVDPAISDAVLNGDADPLTGELAPALWVDGVDKSAVWAGCLESSGYTPPSPESDTDPGELLRGSQRQADAANDWIRCARENGLENLADVTADDSGMAPGPHVVVPLSTPPDLLRSVVAECPTFSEEMLRRTFEGDPTLGEEIMEGRGPIGPLVFAEEPVGLQEEGYDMEASEDGRRFAELSEILYEGEAAFLASLEEERLSDDLGG